MIFRLQFISLIFIFHSCNSFENEKKLKENIEITKEKELVCLYSTDTFCDVFLNNINVRKLKKNQFIKKYGIPDSIDNDGYIYYDSNYFYFNNDGIVTFSIFTDRFILNDFKINQNISFIKDKYPCSYKERFIDSLTYKEEKRIVEKLEFNNTTYFDRILITIKQGQIIKIFYSIDEDIQ
jgi:hypothetical protein